ncbi:unnamed protein product [Rotaria sp. Silwood1]|nr:unnamed protein product [Rotaria sp. Silwood1]
MSLTTKRQLPNLNNEKIRQLNSVLINTEDNIRNVQQNFESFKQTTSLVDKFRNNSSKSTIQRNKGDRFNNDDSKQSILSNEHETSKTTKQSLSNRNSIDSMISSKHDSIVQEYNPLRVWLYREGFARLSGTRYTVESIEDTYVHITNNAIQKTAPNYDPDKGYKWSMSRVRQYLIAKHGHEIVDIMLKQMDDIFIKSLQSVQKIMINDKHCFELYGYDILLDANLKPWLIETNASPSLTASNQEDNELKVRLLDDMLNVIDMEGRLTGKEKRIGGFDLIYNDGPVYYDESGVETFNLNTLRLNSFLGCANDRNVQLRHLYRQNQLIKRMEKAAAAAAAATTSNNTN